MTMAPSNSVPADSAAARQYNRVKRWLEFSDLAVGIVLLLLLLLTGWSGRLRDIAYAGARQHYSAAVVAYVFQQFT